MKARQPVNTMAKIFSVRRPFASKHYQLKLPPKEVPRFCQLWISSCRYTKHGQNLILWLIGAFSFVCTDNYVNIILRHVVRQA